MEGQQLSHYTIGSKIGEGGMGAVYRATDSRLNRTVAIKILPPHAHADPDRQRRFVQEAQSASALIEIRGERDDRDQTLMDVKDFNRCVDYLETRPDIDRARMGYFGISSGANVAPLLLAGEHRIKTAVLLGGAFPMQPMLAEVDPINFAPRVTTPVLMLNGRYDFVEPVETSQRPTFEMLGTPASDKRHVIFETGHAVVTLQPMIKEVLDWLDRYLGLVQIRTN